MSARKLVALLALGLTSSVLAAQDPTPGVDLPTDARSPGSARVSGITVIPVFGAGPTFGFGAGAVGAWRFRVDSTSQPSSVGIGGLLAQRSSWLASVGSRAWARHDLLSFLGGVEAYSVEYNFYGIGNAAGDADQAELLRQKGTAAMAAAMLHIIGKLYVGPQYHIEGVTAHFTHDGFVSPFSPFVVADSNLTTAGLGGLAEWDSRDNIDAPRVGTYSRGTALFNGASFGGDRGYNTYNIWLNHYIPIHRAVLALRGDLCDASDNAPFYDLCLFGSGNDVRGYVAGRYRDHAMFALQGEYRAHLVGRWGYAAFAGVGQVAPYMTQLNWHHLLASAGPGVRYTLSATHHINLGVDYAFATRSSGAFYFRAGEAY